MQILSPVFLIPVHRSRHLVRSVLPMHVSPPPRTSLSPHSPVKRHTGIKSGNAAAMQPYLMQEGQNGV